MARYSAAKIIVRYHIGEPNEVTSDLAGFAYFNDISASDPATSGFFVLYANRQALAYVYCEDEPGGGAR